jgi:hypothetical protein
MTLEELLQRYVPAQPQRQLPSIEGLLASRPEAEMKAYSADTFTPGLLNGKPTAAKRLGLLGAAFAPGAGFSDYAGTFPAAEGGFEPSATQNWREGNYITSALQGLGAFGDAATLSAAALGPFAPIAAGVGMTAKAPRAAQKAVKGLIDSAQPAPKSVMPQVDELGFYSAVEKAVLDNPQQKGTGQQFLAQIQKTPGVKPEELQYTGLDQFLANKPNVTKTEIQDFLDTNRVQLQEVTLGQYKNKSVSEMTDRELASFYRQTMDMNVAEEYGSNWRQLRRDIEAELTNPELEMQAPAGSAQFSTYTIPGGKNYREVLLTLPENNQAFDSFIGSLKTKYGNIPYGKMPLNEIELDKLQKFEANVDTSNPFRTIHFDQPNILAHMRLNDRTIDGKPTLFVEEIQSDWHQTGRKSGYTTQESKQAETDFRAYANELSKKYDIPEGQNIAMYGRMRNISPEEIASYEKLQQSFIDTQGAVPDAPFKTSWHDLTLKKAINEAASKGYDQIAFTTGKTQAERYPDDTGKRLSGMEGFYDKILPKSLEKLGKKYGVKPVLTDMDTPDGKVQVWKFPVPKEMAESVKSQGQPLFQIGAGAVGLGAAGLLATEDEEF